MLVAIPTHTSEDDHIELRYAIRSMIKHFKDFSGVVLIGVKPTWYKGEFIEFIQEGPKRKEYWIIQKTLKMFGRFLYSNDDFFATKDFDSNLPHYYDNTCRKMAIIKTDHYYKLMYKNCPDGWLNYEIHCPMVFNSLLLKGYLPKDWQTVDRPMKSIYGNNSPYKNEYLQDCKIRGVKRYEDLKGLFKHPFPSTCDNVGPDLLRLLNELYPNKSIFET